MDMAPLSPIQRLEAAENHLTDALASYSDTCFAMEYASFDMDTRPTYLVSRLDRAISFIDTVVSLQLAKSRSSLAICRSKLKIEFHMHRLPLEILRDIFHMFVNSERPCERIEDGIKTVYRRVHLLTSVCSHWRNIILSNGLFWSLIPSICDSGEQFLDSVIRRSISRAANSDLHLAAVLGSSMPSAITSALTEHAPRFRSLNVTANSKAVISELLALWADYGGSGSVAELSIRSDYLFKGHGSDYPYIFQPGSSQQTSLNRRVESLRTLRTHNILFHFDYSLLTKLEVVELSKITFKFEFGPSLFELLQSVSYAPALRVLKITSLDAGTTPTDEAESNTPGSRTPISFPKLQALYLEDIFPDVMEFILVSIASGPHRVVLRLENNSVLGATGRNIHDLLAGLQNVKASTLQIHASVLLEGELELVLKQVPTLRSLYLQGPDLSLSCLRALVQASEVPSTSPSTALSSLSALYMSRCTICDPEAFITIISSCPVETLTLGGYISHGRQSDTKGHGSRVPIDRADEIVSRLEALVPDFRLLSPEEELPEFEEFDTWQLW